MNHTLRIARVINSRESADENAGIRRDEIRVLG
jgi:hypothetical protein